MKAYVWECDLYLASKAVKHKPYNQFPFLSVLIYFWKKLAIDLVTRLLPLTNWEKDSEDTISVKIDRVTKMIYYKPIKRMIDAVDLVEIIIKRGSKALQLF